jgi:arginyl-tRNA synthetase
VDVSIAELKRDFNVLGVHFDLWYGESSVHDRIAPMVERLQESGHAVMSEGAIIIPVTEEGDESNIPPLILVKSDGGVLYGTTDLATIEERVEELGAGLILYVVDARQSLHFEQVFRAAQKTGIARDARMEHLGFGTVSIRLHARWAWPPSNMRT